MLLPKICNNISFKGYDKRLDEKGNPIHSFYYPYDEKKYKLQLELLTTRKNGSKQELSHYDINNKSFDLTIPENIDNYLNLYYRFKLIDRKNKNNVLYAFDNGLLKNFKNVQDENTPFNQIFADRKIVSKAGRMQLQLPDMYYPGVKYENGKYIIDKTERKAAISSVKNHISKLGGTLNGMTYMLPQKAKEGYTRIVGTPFTKDEISSHLYWTQNAYQMSDSVGNQQDMKRFQQALFKNGINFIADAALVNEGLLGIHFASLMKWGKDSPFYTWFKTYNLDSNTLSLGVIPQESDNVRMKIINSPVNGKYDPKKPTYVQLYDARLVTDEQVNSDKPFIKYNNTPKNHYEITKYDDAVIPYVFEVNPQELAYNIKLYDGNNKNLYSDKDTIMNILNFKNFKIGERTDGGVELWDGNVDIAKLNFSFGNYDSEMVNKGAKSNFSMTENNYRQGVREVQDYAVLSGSYWTKSAADIQLEYAANIFKNVNDINDALRIFNSKIGKDLPAIAAKNVNKNIINNVINDDYNLFKLNNITSYTKIDKDDNKTQGKISSYSDILKKSIMNIPLESLEVGDDVLGILSSGYMSKRAATNEQIGLGRFDIYMSDYPNLPQKYSSLYKRTDKLLANDVYKFVDKVLSGYDNLAHTEKIKNEEDTTNFGKYAINAIAKDLVKYALIKSLDEKANITVENDGTLNFDNIDRSRLNLKALNIKGVTPEHEAAILLKRMETGLSKLSSKQGEINKLISATAKRFKGLNENSFKLADMIIDRTESGIGLRVDAAKDIAAVDSARDTQDDISKIWNNVIDFWSKYVKDGVQKENPHAYTTAEVTDIADFVQDYSVADLHSASEADRKMLEKAGVTSIANYSYLFSMPVGIYSKNAETGDWNGYKKISDIKSKIDCLDNIGWKDNSGFIFEGMPDSSIHSYTFVGNHDKPRILHILGLDMALYNYDRSDADSLKDEKESKRIEKCVKDVLNYSDDTDINWEEIESTPAIAMGKRIKDVLRDMADSQKGEKLLTEAQFEKLSEAIESLAQGIYKYPNGKIMKFNADSFGEKPFDVVINDVYSMANLNLPSKKLNILKDKTLEKMLAPAMQKFKSIYKMLTLLPGDPTDFAGDKEGMTGFESVYKNLSQQNRNAIRWEWLDKKSGEYKPFIDKYKHEINEIMALRLNPKLSALNDGHTVSLVNFKNAEELAHSEQRDYAANFRYNNNSMVLTIFGRPSLGDKYNPNELMNDNKVEIPYINLSKVRSREGLSGGLKIGTVFKNVNEKDKSIYKVEQANWLIPKEIKEKDIKDDTKLIYCDNEMHKYYEGNESDAYVIKRYENGKEIPITIDKNDDNAIVLYKI